MICPKCSGKTTVFDNSHIKDQNETYRRRKCLVCGHKFVTVEFEVEWDEQVATLYASDHRFKRRNRDKRRMET